MSEQSVCSARTRVMESMARVRELERTCSGQILIDGLKYQRQLRRESDLDMLRTIARLECEGTFARNGTPVIQAVADLQQVRTADAAKWVRVARALFPTTLAGLPVEPKCPATAAALGEYVIGLAHAEVITHALGSAAASRLEPAVWAYAEIVAAGWARERSPNALQVEVHNLIAHLDQDGPEPPEDGDGLVNDLHLTPHRDGGGRVKATLDPETYEQVARAVGAAAKPLTAEDKRPLGQRQADALGEICGHALDEGRLPASGGERPHVTITMTLEQLERLTRGTTLEFGGPISAAKTRMLLCDAVVIPAVLGGEGQVLDVGRAQRIATVHQRRALAARDRGCSFPGCPRPIHRCHAHHIVPWSQGGRTDLDNMAFLCATHHGMVHESEWQMRIRDGQPEFVPPKWLDHEQKPLRKPRLPSVASPK